MQEITDNSTAQRNLTLLSALSEAIANVANTESLFQIIFEILRPVFRFDLGVIQLISEDRQFMEVFLPGVSAPAELQHLPAPRRTRIPISELWMPRDLNDPNIHRIQLKDIPKNYHMDSTISHILEVELGVREMLLCPLRRGGRLIGHLMLATGRRGRVRDEDIPLLSQVCRVVAGAVENTVSYERLARKENDTERLLRFTSTLLERQDFEGFLTALATGLQDLRPFQFLSLVGLSSAETSDRCILHDGQNWRQSTEAPVPWQEGGSAGESEDTRVRIRYLNQHDLDITFAKSAEALSLTKRNGIVAAVLMRLDPGESAPVTLFLGANEEQATALMVPGIFEQAAPQLLLAIRSLQNWQRIQVLQNRLHQENRALFEEISAPDSENPMIGESPLFRQCLSRARMVASVDTTVLIQGETGTGKEVMARYLHDHSPRHGKPLVRVNCASLPSQLVESELFGHERGAFTGAVERRIGKFELAQGGTIFLDEIGELPLESQSKILRVLQERELERVGGKNVIPIDVRVLTATNRDLETEVRKGNFRADLYFRLNVFPITLPPLRERREDIPVLADTFLRRFSKRFGRPLRPLTHEEGELLMAYPWPGNIRELEHLIERSAITAQGMDPNLREFRKAFLDDTPTNVPPPIRPLDELVRSHIVAALKQTQGKVSGPDGAAALLGLNGKTLDSKMRKYSIQRRIDFI